MDDSIDYRLVCRTCLASEAEFYKLDASIFADDDEDKVSFIECLKYCTKLEDFAEFPIYICTECSTALQVAYNFMKNALEAHEILRQKLCPPNSRANGQLANTQERKVSFRCKICAEKVDSKKSLKEHVKLHLDLISYNCNHCLFQTKKRSLLNDHYLYTHGVLATKEQLKPLTTHQPQQTPKLTTASSCFTTPIQTQSAGNQLAIPQSNQLYSTQPMNVAQFLASSDIPLEMATVIASRPNSSDAPITYSSTLQNFSNEINLGNNLSIGNEFVVMQDGTVQEVMQNGVVINYINATGNAVELDNGIFLNNLLMQNPEAGGANVAGSVDMVNMANDVNMLNMANDVNIINMPDNNVNMLNMADSSVNLVSMADNANMVSMTDNQNLVNGSIQCEGLQTTNDYALNVNLDGGATNMDIDDIIVEDKFETVNKVAEEVIQYKAPIPKVINTARINKQIVCKMCKSLFPSQELLKKHMLTHNEIPHFFCDICDFYTFFKIDLTQHYKTKHSIQPSSRQLQPKNKVNFNVPEGAKKVFLCELCIYDTPLKAILRRHYLSKHQIEATEMQLRPTRVMTAGDSLLKKKVDEEKSRDEEKNRSYPNGINCTKCSKTFYWENDLNEHHKQHIFEESLVEKARPTVSVSVTVNNLATGIPTTSENAGHLSSSFPNDLDVDVEKLIACNELKATVIPRAASPHLPTPTPPHLLPSSPSSPTHLLPTASQSLPLAVVDGSSSIVPPDAIPQIVETDSIVVDNMLNFDFNGDAIFEDDSEENDDEEFQDLLLTTDDEQEYAKEISGSSRDAKRITFCVQCNKNFATYYQFENHMFVHRGLAPYRCEMCTNLYNTKRDLIRHYHAVHKAFPTRDMIQAKGDKVPTAERTNVHQLLNAEKTKSVRLMCAKCPYEVVDINDIKAHLNIIHGIDDDNYILKKLPFECPKCIRTFDSNARLARHTERNHSSSLICHKKEDNNDNVSCKRCELKDHLLLCNETTSFECLFCDFVFETKTKLIAHQNQYHNDDIDTKQSKELQPQQQQQQQHEGQQLQEQQTCTFCHNKYRSKMALKIHMKRHIARNHFCKQCPKSFISNFELEHHKLTHTGEYPHQCDVCHKLFRYLHHMKRHKSIKHEVRRYVCEAITCQQSFHTVSEFQMHADSHDWNEFSTLYRCQYCLEQFSAGELLRWHASSLHDVNLTEVEIDGSKSNTW